MGEGNGFWGYHDHWTLPDTNGHWELDVENFNSPEEQEQIMGLSPKTRELIQRHNIAYHISPESLSAPDNLFIGLHFENAIYGQRYFGYFAGESAKNRRLLFEHFEADMMKWAPDMPLVLIKASAETIARRMRENPHPQQVVQEADIPEVLDEFESEFNSSSFNNKLTVDTTEGTAEENLAAFIKDAEPYMYQEDKLRILIENARKRGEWI
jgi:hypothetical protein